MTILFDKKDSHHYHFQWAKTFLKMLVIKRCVSFSPKRCLQMSATSEPQNDKFFNELRQFVRDEIQPKASEFDASGKVNIF